MKTKAITLFILFAVCNMQAQKKKNQDIEAIKKMCGCFEVTFNFAETFNYSNDTLYKPSKTKIAKGLEWAGLVTDKDDMISIQHILQVGNPAEPKIVKHWRQDWLFENTNFYIYNADNHWDFEQKNKKDVDGQWTQKVFQVDDSPRYEGSATWIHIDGKSYWENTTPAPLPRREYTARSDYNLTMRGNRQEITDYGWVHDQNNSKILRKEGANDLIIAKEKGYNTYVKVNDNRCTAAANWWEKNKIKWAIVRAEWSEIYHRNKDLSLATKINNKALYKHLFAEAVLEEAQISTVIKSFIKNL